MNRSEKLYNADLAPTPEDKKNWGWFEIFNVWANDVQSLFGYTLAASLFLYSGLNGWAVFAALILAGFFHYSPYVFKCFSDFALKTNGKSTPLRQPA